MLDVSYVYTDLIVIQLDGQVLFRKIMVDYELAVYQAARQVFGNDQVEVRGCYFHFANAIQKKIAEKLKVHTQN